MEDRLKKEGLVPLTLGRTSFSAEAPLKAVEDLMEQCVGTVVVALERSYFESGIQRRRGKPDKILKDARLSTAWNHIEAAMSYVKRIPLLVIAEADILAEGLLEPGYDWYVQTIAPDAASLETEQFEQIMANWKAKLPERPPQPKPDQSSLQFIDIVRKHHDQLSLVQQLKVHRRSFRFVCKTLASGKYDVVEPDDEVFAEDEVVPVKPMLAYGSKLLSEDRLYDTGKISFNTVNKANPNRRVRATTLTLPRTHVTSSNVSYSNVMAFFHEAVTTNPSASEDENSWIISYGCASQEPLSYLAKENYDQICYHNEGSSTVKKVLLLCDVPQKYADIILRDIAISKRPQTDG